MNRLFLPLLLTACQSGLDPTLPLQDAVDQRVDALSHRASQGIAVAVVRDGERLVSSTVGEARPGEPMTLSTPTYLASVSKPLTATVVLQLAGEGALDLDAPVSTYRDGLPTWLGVVTARQLLQHTAGVPNWFELVHVGGPCLDAVSGTTNRDVLKLVREVGTLDFDPGTAGHYSNGGYVLLAEIASDVARMPFAALTQERLGADFRVETEANADAPRARGTRRSGADCDYDLLTTGAGGTVGSVEDLLRLGEGWLAPDVLVDEAFYTQATQPDAPALVPEADGHGLGWFVTETATGTALWHTGHYAGFATVWVVRPADGLVVAAVSNGSTPAVADLGLEILAHPDLAGP